MTGYASVRSGDDRNGNLDGAKLPSCQVGKLGTVEAFSEGVEHQQGL